MGERMGEGKKQPDSLGDWPKEQPGDAADHQHSKGSHLSSAWKGRRASSNSGEGLFHEQNICRYLAYR